MKESMKDMWIKLEDLRITDYNFYFDLNDYIEETEEICIEHIKEIEDLEEKADDLERDVDVITEDRDTLAEEIDELKEEIKELNQFIEKELKGE